MDTDRTTPAREVLLAKLAELDGEMTALETLPGERGEISFGKRVGEGTAMAVDRLSQVGVHDKLQATRADVVRALAKIDEGSYAVCDVCGGPVGDERLEALPWATMCVADAARR
ncbi:MAG: TraR/DksA family transcriptional regulator [Nocardioides sp.]